MKIRIIPVGIPTQRSVLALVEEYHRRLAHYVDCALQPVREERLGRNANQQTALRIEMDRIGKLFRNRHHLVVLDREGQQYDSPAWATWLANHRDHARSLTFLIGGPNGLHPDLLKAANETVSFSGLTFPHDIFLVIFLEQLYRAFTILAGHPYHR